MAHRIAILLLLLATPAFAEPVSFKRDIAPILQTQCLVCHGPKKAGGGYRVDTFEKTMSAGDSGSHGFAAKDLAASETFRRLTSTDKDERMPKDGDPLSPEQIALVKQWIEEGASYDSGDPKAALISIIPPPTHPAAPPTYRAPMPITAIAFSPDGKELFASGYHEITVWSPEDGKLIRRIGNIGQRVYALAFKPNGSQLAVACGAPGRLGEVRVINPTSGEIIKVLAPAADVAYDVAWSAQGDRLATCGADNMIRIYDADSFAEQLSISSHSDWVFAVAWSADGSKLASASRDKTAKVFDAKTGQPLVTFNNHNAAVRGVLFNPDGSEVYSSGADNRVRRFKIADAQQTNETGFNGEVYKTSPVGENYFVPSADNKVRQFKISDNNRIREFDGAKDWCLSAAAHEASGRVAGGTFDGEIRIWNLADGKPVIDFKAMPK